MTSRGDSEKKDSSRNQSIDDRSKFGIGITLLIFIILITIYKPDWAEKNSYLLRIGISIAVGLSAISFAGSFSMNIPNFVKTGGSIGFAFLAFWFYPSEDKKEFDFTAELVNESGSRISPKPNDRISMTMSVEGVLPYNRDTYAENDGKVVFRSLPPRLLGKNVTYKIDSKYFRLKEPGLTYKLKECVSTLIVTPVKIERISGKVKTPGGAGIDSVKILVGVSGELITYTNSNGDFELTLPKGIQHEQITVGASKQGFEYSAGQPTFSSTYDVVSSKNITIIFARKSDPTPSTHTDSTTYSSFILKYENEKITFNFPINPSMKIQHLRDFICDELASAYSSTKAQCHISYYGNQLNLSDSLRKVNLPNNVEIRLVCNGDVIYLNRFDNFESPGKSLKILLF